MKQGICLRSEDKLKMTDRIIKEAKEYVMSINPTPKRSSGLRYMFPDNLPGDGYDGKFYTE